MGTQGGGAVAEGFFLIRCPYCEKDGILVHRRCEAVIDWRDGEDADDAERRHVCDPVALHLIKTFPEEGERRSSRG